MLAMIVTGTPATADDTCIFGVSANDIPPNIVYLLDSGADMEQIVWNQDFDNNFDYIPVVAEAWDVVDLGTSGSPPPAPVNPVTLLLNTVDEDYPFAVGAEVEGLTNGNTAVVLEKTYIGIKLQLVLDTSTITPGSDPWFSVGEIVQRYKNINNIATGIVESVDYTEPSGGSGGTPSNPNGFFNDKGYGIIRGTGGNYFLVKVTNDLTLDTDEANGLQATSGNTWTITVEIDLDGDGTVESPDNGFGQDEANVSRTVTLPASPSTTAVSYTDATAGTFSIIDRAQNFRYSKNYLNWIFFSGLYSGLASDLLDPAVNIAVSRFFYGKLAVMAAAKLSSNKANFGIYYFTNDQRASSAQPLNQVVATVDENDAKLNILEPNFINNVNNMSTVQPGDPYSPLAEGLATIGGYYNSPSSGVLPENYCQDQFVIVVSPGVSSKDRTGSSQDLPTSFSDYDADNGLSGQCSDSTFSWSEGTLAVDTTCFVVPVNTDGSSWLDDVAHYMYTNDMVGYVDGVQNVITYTIGFMADWENNAFLINTSNTGNGHPNLYDTNDANYGDWHFSASSPGGLSAAIIAAVNDIISRTATFTAPVVPVTRTVSGDRVYLALFKPVQGNFWEGNLVKFKIGADGDILDANDDPATYPNGALIEGTVPLWATQNWADNNYFAGTGICDGAAQSACNYIDNLDRNFYTYLGTSTDLTDSTNAFITGNAGLTAAILGDPGVDPGVGRNTLIDYVRGADALDEDGDGAIGENREIITGDILHSEPTVVQYELTDTDGDPISIVFFGSNDGALHAVNDKDGVEAWAFIPPDLLYRLKEMLGVTGHQYYVDSSPKVVILGGDGDEVVESGEQVILVCGERKGGSHYFALDITDPTSPEFLWRIGPADVAAAVGIPAPDTIIPEMGESWSEPDFGTVKDGVDDKEVFFIGAGFSADNSKGKAVLAIEVLTGAVVWQFIDDSGDQTGLASVSTTISDMDYSIPSTVRIVAGTTAVTIGFVDKVYVGDQGSQMFRIGNVSAATFPNIVDQNIQTWTAEVLFLADSTNTQKFFYPPGITLEIGYDLVFMVTGDREDPCNELTSDSVYAVKDDHTVSLTPLTPSDLVDVTTVGTAVNLDGSDNGWFINLAPGEKSLAEVAIFFKVLYFTTFTPNDDPCLPGGEAKLYAVNYKTGGPVITWPGGSAAARSLVIGGGIPSKPVIIITETVTKMIISVGSTQPEDASGSVEAGIPVFDPLLPPRNFFYLWWRELFG